MAFTVQDDTGLIADANAYITVDEFRSYWTDKGTDTSALLDATVEGLIVQATSYIDGGRFCFYGYPVNGRDQTTEFPRSCLYDKYGNEVEGIPREVKDACAEYAYQGNTVALDNTWTASEQGIKREMSKVDVLEEEIEYVGSKSSAYSWNVYQTADQLMLTSGFVCQSMGNGGRA